MYSIRAPSRNEGSTGHDGICSSAAALAVAAGRALSFDEDLRLTDPRSDVARRHHRALGIGGIDVDETDMQPGEGLAAFHVDAVMN